MAGSPRVVIIYRDPHVRESIRFLLETYGWRVTAFASPEECLGVLRPGCLMLDGSLSESASFDLVAELRARGTTVPAILTTPSTDPDLLERAAAAGIAAVDPFAPSALVEAVTAALSGSTAASPASGPDPQDSPTHK